VSLLPGIMPVTLTAYLLASSSISNTVKAAMEKPRSRDTLIIVTADHCYVFTIAGYPMRGIQFLEK